MTVVNSIREIAQTPAQAMGDGASPVMSFNYGEGQYGKVKKGIWFMTALTAAYLAAIWLVLFLFPRPFIRIFNGESALAEAAVPCLHLYFFGFFMMAFQIAGQSVFKSLRKAKQAVFFSLFRKIIIVVPLTLLLPHVAELGVMAYSWRSRYPILSAGRPVFLPWDLPCFRSCGRTGSNDGFCINL